MNRRLFAACILTSLFVAGPATAQEEESEPAAEAAEEAPAEGGEDDAEGEAGDAAADAEGDPAADGETADGEQPVGPGGKPLRTDYPGTEDSLKSRMDTDMIEGLDVDPDAPQAAYGLRIRELETKIDDLKEKVFQSKTRIVLLRETLLSGNLAGARAIIVHKTELGSAWKLQQAFYALDGTKLVNKSDTDADLSDKRMFQVYDGSVSPGSHNLSILVKYKGTNVGLFPYFKGYEGDIKSSCEFKAQEGKIAQVKVAVYPKGGVGQSIEQRPQVRCEVEYFDNLRDSAGDGPAESTEE